MNISATKEFLERFLKDLKKAQKRWCGDCVDDSEEMLMEYPEWIDALVPEVEELLGLPKSGLQILCATYGTDDSFKDVTKLLQENCYPNSLDISVNNSTMDGDPAPGLSKQLKVTYMYNGVEKKEVILEGRELTIAEGKG